MVVNAEYMGRLPQTTEATTREDCTGTSRDVSEKPDAVGSGGNLHAPLHLLPHHQLCGHREGEGQRHPGPWRTQVSASQSVCRNCQGSDWRKAGSRWCWSWPGEVSGGAKDCHLQGDYRHQGWHCQGAARRKAGSRQNRSPTCCWDQESQADRAERSAWQEDQPPRLLKHLPVLIS